MKARSISGFARLRAMDQIYELHGIHRTPLEMGNGDFAVVAHAEDEMATRPGGLEHI